MKSLKKSVVLSLISAILAPAALLAQGAQVVAEDPDGGVVVRGGSSMALSSGSALQAGDVVKSNEATVILSLCDGALVTVYPGSEVSLASLGEGVAVLNLTKGELLGDTTSGCAISVANVVGTADISNGVYGVVLTETGEGYTLQVRNLDGNVTFTGDDQLDISNLTASIVEPGKTLDIPAGEEMIVRGLYNSDSDIFSLVTGGAAMALMSDEVVGELRGASEYMSAVGRPDELPGKGPEDGPPGQDKAADKTEGTPAEDVIIEVPWFDVETASDKG
jgi:hypothetical protein